MSMLHTFAVNLSTNGCLQAIVNDCEFVGHDREQRASFICNDYDLKMMMFVITRNYMWKLLHLAYPSNPDYLSPVYFLARPQLLTRFSLLSSSSGCEQDSGNGKHQIPSDLVVKSQVADIID